VTQVVHITRNWERQIRPATDKAKRYLSLISKYDFDNMPPGHLVTAAHYFDELGQQDMVVRLSKVVLSKPKAMSLDAQHKMALLLAKVARDAETARMAIKALHEIETKTRDMRQQAALALTAGETSLNILCSPDLAEKEFSRVATKYASADRTTLRKALVGLGDVYREKGDYDKARTAHKQLALISAASGSSATSAWSSPSMANSGAIWRASSVAWRTLSTSGWAALP
jgi:lipopolysaccharide biosynthesis regulator YciM